jgi:hypothetical protein
MTSGQNSGDEDGSNTTQNNNNDVNILVNMNFPDLESRSLLLKSL